MTYAIPKARANYEIFDTRFQGAKVWNDIGDLSLKHLKKKFDSILISRY